LLLYSSNLLLGFPTGRSFYFINKRNQVFWHYSTPRHQQILHKKQHTAAQRHLRTGELATVGGCSDRRCGETATYLRSRGRVARIWQRAMAAAGRPDAVAVDLQLRGSMPAVGIGRGTRGASEICGGCQRRSGGFSQRWR
jgi:hypothetical protein